jgi:hypothetical protein
MSPEEKFNAMVMAMIGDDEWVALVEDEIAREDSIEWLFAPVEDETDEYEDDMLDRDFWAKGQW